jgi:hypothetical protein
LSFVVICAAGVETSVAYRGFKGFRVPKFQRFDWHYVVVGIDEDGGNI